MSNWLNLYSRVSIRPAIEELEQKTQLDNMCLRIKSFTEVAISIDEELSNLIKGLFDYIVTNYNNTESAPIIEEMTKHHLNHNTKDLFDCLRQNYRVFKFSPESSFWRAVKVICSYLKVKQRVMQ